MTEIESRSGTEKEDKAAGPRAVLRVLDVLMALASRPGGSSLAELAPRLGVPKTSLHRLLRTLENGGYLTVQGNNYKLGSAAFHLASVIGSAAPATAFPACARPVLEWLAHESRDTVMLGVLIEDQQEILYIDIIDSEASVRFSVPVGDRRPLYAAASGKAVLAFLKPEAQQAYLDAADFRKFTPYTTGRDELAAELSEFRRSAVAFDSNGREVGASGLASPIFDSKGKAFASVSVAGLTDRIIANREQLSSLVRSAGERISRLLGFSGAYPPPS